MLKNPTNHQVRWGWNIQYHCACIIIPMAPRFECPACGGMLDYPQIDKIIDEYDLRDKDKYYYEDVFEEQLTVTCAWCKKRVEVPLDLPAIAIIDPLEQFDALEAINSSAGTFHLWPDTALGKVILGLLALWYLLLEVPAVLLFLVPFFLALRFVLNK